MGPVRVNVRGFRRTSIMLATFSRRLRHTQQQAAEVFAAAAAEG